MINLTLNYLQILGIIVAIVVTYIIATFLIGLFLKSQWWLSKEITKKAKLQEKLNLTKKQIMYRNFVTLAKFISWLDKQFVNSKQRKTFWSDFIKNPNTRIEWIKKFQEQYNPDTVKVTKKQK